MNYIYASTLSSMILFSSMGVFAMHSNQSGQNSNGNPISKNSEIVNASIIEMYGREYFNVSGFKKYITTNGASLTAHDLISASQSTYARLNYDPQERIIAKRDYTAAMIAINRINPETFWRYLIENNKQEVRSYYATNEKLLHVANHRFGSCNCETFADCNWPTIKK